MVEWDYKKKVSIHFMIDKRHVRTDKLAKYLISNENVGTYWCNYQAPTVLTPIVFSMKRK